MATTPDEPFDADVAGDTTPRPDPTRRTLVLVKDAITAYREVFDTRLAGMDKATELVARDVARVAEAQENQRQLLRADVDRQVAALREYLLTSIDALASVSIQRFTAVTLQFGERDERIKQADIERQKSLDAALAAQKEAVREQNTANDRAIAKSDQTTQKQIDAQAILTTTSVASLDDKIRRLESRLDRGEAGAQATARTVDTSVQARRADTTQNWLALSVVISAIAIIVTILISRG